MTEAQQEGFSPATTPLRGLSVEGKQWTRLVALHAQVDGLIEKALHRHCALGLSEFLALAACAASDDGEMRMQELTEAVYLNQSSVSRLVARLERSGLTERRLCELDRRGVYTGITEHGLKTLGEAVPVYENALAEAMAHAELDPELKPILHALRSQRSGQGE
ncbi:DNA-binding MarR family transcriptional regulator [Actinopolyspora lacussalsi]|uniref:DNA-binding transcriptional regulator, MarR family n=1 Tax=Actinopolyspora righensis TaxID=995060 RepID=A0A1I7BZ18_9ACTN|nr:MarR family transcriptional regulator [Actinopolyspora righensis]MDP9643157.1 DNA-binding MarR family transcriptional regulator [Actinopolyspora lacussalsi]SFT92378.1 DNA-binding transcriptional regulator, MarR family [Actinopolyspora righensis]